MSTHQDEAFDVIVIGAGIAGETCARRVACDGRLRVALIERAHVGGEAATWTAIPSSRLLGPANTLWQIQAATSFTSPAVGWPSSTASRDYPTREQIGMHHMSRLREKGITVVHGDARVAGPQRIVVQGEREQVLDTQYLVLATGSQQRRPDLPGLAETGYWTSREASAYTTQPASLVVLGGGAHAVEIAQVFRHYGTEVTLIAETDHLIPYEDPEVGQMLEQHLRHSGIRLIMGRHAVQAKRDQMGTRLVLLDDGAWVTAQVILVVNRRVPYTDGLELENLKDVRMGEHGNGIAIDASCRAGEGIWAIGDVTGVAHRTHVALYQARLAADDILGHSHPAHYESVPRVVFTDPQVAATGLTRAQAQAQQIAIVSATLDLTASWLFIPTRTTLAPTGGRLTLHADARRSVLVGAWAVGADASEWMHLAVLAIRAQVPLSVLYDTVEQFPPFSEGYLRVLDDLTDQLKR